MIVMIVGGGGREHALAWKLSQSADIKKILAVPGNAGMRQLAHCLDEDPGDTHGLAELALQNQVDLTVVGPEAPLVEGVVDVFREKGLRILGPTREGALLEGSKAWAKGIMYDSGIPTAPFKIMDDYQDAVNLIRQSSSLPVIKADGLAAGKGVLIPKTREEAEKGLRQIMVDRCFGEAGNQVVLEDKLNGEEASLLALTDGSSLTIMPPAQDHKPIGEGDTGPNTGGMGAYSPAPVLTQDKIDRIKEQVFWPLLKELKNRGIDYRGVIYAGLIVTPEDFHVLEFNVRLGDPEAQALLPLLDSDLLPLLVTAADGNLQGSPRWKSDAAVCLVLASQGYPGKYEKGKVISGLDKLSGIPGISVFHAGTSLENGRVVTSGGRVLGVTSWQPDLTKAVHHAYQAVKFIDFDGCYYRKDIGYRALE